MIIFIIIKKKKKKKKKQGLICHHGQIMPLWAFPPKDKLLFIYIMCLNFDHFTI